jgi:hypothetical protein
MAPAYDQDEIDAAATRLTQMAPGAVVKTTDLYAGQSPARGLPWRGTVVRITKSGLVCVRWRNSPVRREETLHPLFLEIETD